MTKQDAALAAALVALQAGVDRLRGDLAEEAREGEPYGDTSPLLHGAVALSGEAETVLVAAVRTARAAGMPWSTIGQVLGLDWQTRQAASQWLKRHDNTHEVEER